MKRWKIAVATRLFELPLKDALVAAAKAGADGVQFDVRSELPPAELSQTGRRHLLKQLSDYGLAVASLHIPFRRALYDQAYLERRLDLVRQVMQMAYDLKSGVVTLRAGSVPAQETEERRLLVEVLNDLARYGNHVGAVLAVTPSVEPPGPLLDVLQQVQDGPIGVDFDPSVFVSARVEATDAFRELHEWVQHVVVRDAVRDMDGSVEEVPVGRGDVTWDELLALLEEARYGGWLTVLRTTGEDRAGDAARAIQYVRNVVAEF